MSRTLGSRCPPSIFCFSSIQTSLRFAKQLQQSQVALFPRRYASKASRSARSRSSSPPSPLPRTKFSPTATPGYLPTQDLLTNTLANKSSPTLLYLAPTSNTFAITCLGVGASAISYGAFNFYDAYFISHPGLWWLVPYLMAGVSFFMIGTGVWVGLGARRLVGTLSAVPVRNTRTQNAVRGALEDAGLVIRMESKPILPFISTRSVEAPLSEVRLGTYAAPVAAGLTTYNSALQAPGQRPLPARQLRREAELKTARENQEQTLWQVLIGPIKSLLKLGSHGIGRVVARDGFVSLYVQGKMWRIDARDGWLLDDGATVDRLLKLR